MEKVSFDYRARTCLSCWFWVPPAVCSGAFREKVAVMDWIRAVLEEFWDGVCAFAKGLWEWVRLADYLFWGIVGLIWVVGIVVGVVNR